MRSQPIPLIVLLIPLLSAHADEVAFTACPGSFSCQKAEASAPGLMTYVDDQNFWDLALDPENSVLFASNPTSGEIVSFDTDAATPTPTVFYGTEDYGTEGLVPHGLTLVDGQLYLLDSKNDEVLIFTLPDNRPTSLGSGLVRPNDLVVDASAERIYITDSGLDQVLQLDLDGTTLASIDLDGAWGIAADPRHGRLYASSYTEGNIYELDFSSAHPTKTLLSSGLDRPRGLAFNRFGELTVFEAGADALKKVKLSDGQLSASPYSGAGANGHGFFLYDGKDQDGDFLADSWERSEGGNLARLDASSDKDGDGFPALAEYMFGGDTRLGEGNLISSTSWNPTGTSVVEIAVRRDDAVRVEFEVSLNLKDWLRSPSRSSPIEDQPFDLYQVEINELDLFEESVPSLFFQATATPNR